MTDQRKKEEMMSVLGELLATEDRPFDFTMPSLLKDVPSFTSSDTATPKEVEEHAELGGRAH